MRIVDMHCDTITALYARQQEGIQEDLKQNGLHIDLEKLKAGDYLLQNFAVFVHMGSEKKPFEYCMRVIDHFYTEIEKYPELIGAVRTYEDIEKNIEAGRMSALLTIEEGAVCQGEIEFLRDFYRLGVRMLTLTWNFPNEIGFPNQILGSDGKRTFGYNTEEGLTEKGIEFVKEMNRLGMIIDVSHLSDAGFWDVVKYTNRPFVASHSDARAMGSHPRNMSDEMIRALSEKGGVMGINYAPSFLEDRENSADCQSTPENMVRHMKHIVNVGGIQCLGLGSDFDGIRGNLHIDSAAKMYMLEDEMKKNGFSSSDIDAIFGGNVLRVYKEML